MPAKKFPGMPVTMTTKPPEPSAAMLEAVDTLIRNWREGASTLVPTKDLTALHTAMLATLATHADRARREAVETAVSYLLGWADDRGGTDEKILRDVANMMPSALRASPSRDFSERGEPCAADVGSLESIANTLRGMAFDRRSVGTEQRAILLRQAERIDAFVERLLTPDAPTPRDLGEKG